MLLLSMHLCKSRVGELRAELLVEKDVLRLEVAMNGHALACCRRVQVEQRVRRLPQDPEAGLPR